MADPNRSFQVVSETDEQPKSDNSASIAAISLALKALSQRAIVALGNLFTLFTVFSAFWLWHSIPEPSVNQLTGLGMYALFVLAANFIVRHK